MTKPPRLSDAWDKKTLGVFVCPKCKTEFGNLLDFNEHCKGSITDYENVLCSICAVTNREVPPGTAFYTTDGKWHIK